MSAWALLVGWLFALAAPEPVTPSLPAVEAPAIGVLLVANPQVHGYFAETVIVLIDHGAGGSMGVMVNRPLAVTLDELLPAFEEARGHSEQAWEGGPVEADQVLLLLRASDPPARSSPVFDDVHVSGHRNTLRELLESGSGEARFRAYVGYAGWSPGQLDAEIARGDWTLAPGEAAAVFTDEPGKLWPALYRRHRRIEVRGPRGPLARDAKSITLSPPWRSAAASSASRTSGRARSSTP